MECREVKQLAEAFVSEQLLVETTQAVVSHLQQCPACRGDIAGLRRLRTATRLAFENAPDLTVRPEFVAALQSHLKADAHQRPTRLSRRRWLAIAASSLLAVGSGWGWREWSATRFSALLQAAVGDHRFCALTFKLTERPIPLHEAARRYGRIYELFEAVEPSTTALNGGALRVLERHSCVFNGRRFVHLVLRYKDEAVSLLVTDDPRSNVALGADRAGIDATPLELSVSDGFHVASYHGERHVVFVVSSLNADDVQEVARAMVAPVSRALAGA